MFKSQLEPPSENFVETQIFVENIFDTVKKAREAKAARSLAESKLAHYDYSFDFSPSKRKKARKNAKAKATKVNKGVGNSNKTTPKKKPRKPRTPKDSNKKKQQQQQPTTPKTPRKYTKRAKVKPQNDIDDEEAAFILSSISQRSFDSFYNRLNGNATSVVQKIQIPLEAPTVEVAQPTIVQQQLKKPETSHLTAYHHVLLDHNYWIVEPPTPETVAEVVEQQQQPQKNLLMSVASTNSTNSNSSIKVEVNNNKLPLLDVNCETPKQQQQSTTPDNAVKKRWLRQATTECSSPTVTPPEMSPNDMKAPLKKRRVVMDDNNEIIRIGACSETESSKIDQTMNNNNNNNNNSSFRNNVEAIKFNDNNNFVNSTGREIVEDVNSTSLREPQIMNSNFKDEPRSVIQSPMNAHHQLLHGIKNNLTYGIQMSSPVDVNAIYGRNQVDLMKIDAQNKIQERIVHGNELKLNQPHTQMYDEKLIKLEPERQHDFRSNNVNIVEMKFNEKIPQVYGIKTEVYDNMQHAVKTETYDQKPIKVEEKVITVDGKLQQILDGKIQKIYRDNSQYFMDNGSTDQKVYGQQFYNKIAEPAHQMSVIHENSYRNQIENHIIIHTGNAQSVNDKISSCAAQKATENSQSFNDQKVFSIYGENHVENYPKISPTKLQQGSPTKIGQLKGFSSPTKIQISPTRTYEIYTKNPHENVAESLLKLQQESPVKLLQLSPTKVIQSPTNFQVPQPLNHEMIVDHGYLKAQPKKPKKTVKNPAKTKAVKVKKTPTKVKKAQQKPKKVKAPKSPTKAAKTKKNAKIDKNLIKNFTDLEDVPLKIRQNLSMNDEVLIKLKDGNVSDIKTPTISNFNHLIPQIDVDKPQNLQIFEKCNKIFNDIENQKNLKRTISESSSGSSKSSSKHPKVQRSPPKNLLKKLKFEDSGSEKDIEVKLKNLMDGHVSSSTQNPKESPNVIASKIIESLIPKKLNFDDVSVASPSKVTQNSSSPQNTATDGLKAPIVTTNDAISIIQPVKEEISQKVIESTTSSPQNIKSEPEQLKYSELVNKSSSSLISSTNNTKSLEITNTDLRISKFEAGPSILSTKLLKSESINSINKLPASDNDSDTDTAESETSDTEVGLSRINEVVTKKVRKISSSKGCAESLKNENALELSKRAENLTSSTERSSKDADVKLSSVEEITAPKIVPEVLKFEALATKSVNTIISSSAVKSEKENSQKIEIEDAKPKNSEVSAPIVEESNQKSQSLASNLIKSSIATQNSSLDNEKLSFESKETEKVALKSTDSVKSEDITSKSEILSQKVETSEAPDEIIVSSSTLDQTESQKLTSPQKVAIDTLKPSIDPQKPSVNPLEITESTKISLELIIPSAATSIIQPLISPIKPEVVEQQVASILEKVIPKTLKSDPIKEIETEEIKNEPETDPVSDVEDEDDTPYRETVEEFHKDTLEKLMQANRRFCREGIVHNPFKHSVSYDGRYTKSDSGRSRGYDNDDHRKPLKMSLSFDSHPQYQHQSYPPQYQRSVSEVFNDPRKERWSGNGIYENRNYGSFHYDKIHHREPITTTYSMYRAQKASQVDSRWNNRPSYEYQQEPQHKVNSYVPEKPQIVPQSQPVTPTVINNYRAPLSQPETVRIEPPALTVSPQAEALISATSEPFGGFLKEKLNATPAALPKTKTASSDPRLNPSLVQDIKKDEPATPKKKLSLDQYRKRKSLTNVTQLSSSDDNVTSISVSLSESPSPTLPPAFDPTIAAAAATG